LIQFTGTGQTMEFVARKKGKLLILRLSGVFEYSDEARVSSLLRDNFSAEISTIAVDLTNIDTINSSGVATILTLLRMSDDKKIEFVLYGMNQKVLMLLEKVFTNDYVPLLTEEEFAARYK
jgi:anti-anti-sigma factor